MDKRETIQNQAYEKWIENNRIGTLVLHTGAGKMSVFLRAIKDAQKGSKILLLAETTLREKTFFEDVDKFNEIWQCNLLEGKEFIFACYQSAYKWKNQHFDLVCLDECQDVFSTVHVKFLINNTFDQLMGLTATPKEEVEYAEFTKGDLYKKYCPIIFRYELKDGIEVGTSRKLNIFIIQHLLDNKDTNIKLGKKNVTERTAYEFHHRNFVRKIMSEAPSNVITFFASKRANFLYNLSSKLAILKPLTEFLEESNIKSVIFGNSVSELLKLSKNTISSRNSKVKNDKILEDFGKDKIKTICSFKMLQQGANLPNLDGVILHSYYGKEGVNLQRLGRGRLNGNKPLTVVIICTMHTVEEQWLKKMLKSLQEDKGLINYYSYFGVEDFKVKFKKVNESSN